MPWPLGLNTCGPVDEMKLELLLQLGFACVYLDGSVLDAERGPAAVAAVGKYADRIKPWSVHLPILFRGWDDDERQTAAELERLLDRAAEAGVCNATLHLPCYAAWSQGVGDSARGTAHRAMAMGVIRQGAACGLRSGIRLNLENAVHHGGGDACGCCIADSASAREYLAELQADGVGICLDTGHCLLAGQDPAAMIRGLGSLLQETHFNDNCGTVVPGDPYLSDYHRPPGIGKIDWLDVMDALEETGFPHPVVFELGMIQVGGDTYEYLARATYGNWRAFERVRAKRDGRDPAAL
jgi:sugar phosphate isomerase/epimerase